MIRFVWLALSTWILVGFGVGFYEIAVEGEITVAQWITGIAFLCTWAWGWATDVYARCTRTGEYAPWDTLDRW